MKILALSLLVSVAILTACSKNEESSAVVTPASVDTPAISPAPVDTAATSPALASTTANAPVTGAAPAAFQTAAKASLTSAAGSSVKGDLMLTNEGNFVSIRGEITGLAPGKEHGFHVHEIGECSLPDFESAGEHFNPTNDPHGGPKSKSRHLGDIANVKADKDGRATIDISAKGLTLVDKDGAPTQILGKALIVHAMPDDYETQPSGDSGARIACGVIR
jgi:superoxide dismutase, Cu-Zn family